MSQNNKPQITVSLTESNWNAIMNILQIECQRRGEDWRKWSEGINLSIKAAIEATTKANNIDMEYSGRLCPDCGGPMYQVGTYDNLSWHVYKCGQCGETHSVEMSRSEMRERGDFSFLEDWELGMEDDW